MADFAAMVDAQRKYFESQATKPYEFRREQLKKLQGWMTENEQDILDALLARRQCFSLRELAVDGRDMMALGLRGRDIGAALQFLLDAVLDGAANDREALLALAKERLAEPWAGE